MCMPAVLWVCCNASSVDLLIAAKSLLAMIDNYTVLAMFAIDSF